MFTGGAIWILTHGHIGSTNVHHWGSGIRGGKGGRNGAIFKRGSTHCLACSDRMALSEITGSKNLNLGRQAEELFSVPFLVLHESVGTAEKQRHPQDWAPRLGTQQNSDARRFESRLVDMSNWIPLPLPLAGEGKRRCKGRQIQVSPDTTPGSTQTLPKKNILPRPAIFVGSKRNLHDFDCFS